jgi:CDP-glycerol glycerophosphotransferase (TagB/SpsB family)
LLDVRFELANSYGGGEARTFAVMGEHFEHQYRQQGVRGKRIAVTGHPTHDLAYRQIQELTDARRAQIRERYGIDDGEAMVLYATQPFFWRGVITPEQLRENVEAMNSAVARLGDSFRLTIKIHPRESIDDYAFCTELSPSVRVIAQAEMVDLIACSEIFVSSSSSTVLLAMMLDRPIVTVNFNEVLHFDYFERLGGTLHARTYQDFATALGRIVNDEATRALLEQSRHEALGRLARFDGRAAQRIADLLTTDAAGAAA